MEPTVRVPMLRVPGGLATMIAHRIDRGAARGLSLRAAPIIAVIFLKLNGWMIVAALTS